MFKGKLKLAEGKESFIVYTGLAFAYILLIILVFIVYTNLVEQIKLKMKFNSEKSFNTVYMALVETPSRVEPIMKEENVLGIGIYSSNGVAYQYLGDTPKTLPLTKLGSAKQKGDDSTLGVYIFDAQTNTIEYFRLSRFNVAMETGNLTIGKTAVKPANIPEIVYVKFRSDSYFRDITELKIITALSVIIISGVMAIFLNIFKSNNYYRSELQKNENLVHMGEAARTLAHEIKNPLSAMTLQSALLRKELPPEYTEGLNVLDGEIQRLSNLTNRVSEFMRNPVGNPVRLELVSFISDIAKLFKTQVNCLYEKDLKLYVQFDPDRARSVFENLIKNATESCLDRDPEVYVLIRKKRHTAVIEVMDRGDGIPKEDLNKIFNPFFTTKIHGSGIGLSLCRQFIKARGGNLKLSGRDGGGTIATVTLPCAEEKDR